MQTNNNQVNEDIYLKGAKNRGIRYYFYLSSGMSILNEFRNLFLALVAIYITLKITNIFILSGIFTFSIIGLTILGYFTIHHVNKVKEWLSIKFGTHYGFKTFNYQEQQYKVLVEMLELLKTMKK